MTTISLTGFPSVLRGRRLAEELAELAGARLARAWRNFMTRRQLAQIDDRMLQDLGISRAQAHFEANRPIWR